MRTTALAWIIIATSVQAIESFSVKVGGREIVVAVISPPEGKLAKDPSLLLTFAGERNMSLLKEPYCKAAKIFVQNGHRAASFDLPGHGDRIDRFGKSIGSFKNAFVAGTDVFANFAEDGRAVISECIRRGLAKPGKIAVAGTSRGGYMALRLLPGDDRVVAGAGFAPVTDWRMLTEFAAVKDRAAVADLCLANFTKRMAGRHVYLAIGKTDDRVGTEACCELNRALVSAGSLVEFNLTDDKGHTMGADGYEKGARFLLQRIGPKPAKLSLANCRTILLVDDNDVLYRSGTVRVLHPAKRHPQNPVILQDKPWEVAIGWSSIHRDPKSGKYQLWYQAYAGERAGDKRLECVVCYAESEDGVRFVKPEFDFHPFKEFKETNIVLIGNGGYGDRYCNCVLVDRNEKDTARRYKMAYYDWSVVDGREYPGLHVAFSPDGIRWTKHDKGPLYRTSYGGRGLPPPFADEDGYKETPGKSDTVRKTWHYPLTMSDAADVFFDPVRGAFVIYGKMWMDAPDGTGAWKHGMGRVESKDFLHWSKPQFILAPDDQDAPDTEFHTSPVFFHADRYFCLNQIMDRRAKGAIDIELMTSRDGLVWERSFRQPYFLARSEAGQFDSRCLFSNSTPIVLDDEIRFYYGAYNQSPIGGVRSETGHRSGVGLATIPRDRFAGVRPVSKSSQPTLKKPLENIGQVTLKPHDLTGVKTISLNADASKGEVRLEVLTEDGYRVRGFSKDDAVPLQDDSLNHSVAWKNRDLSELPPGRYMLRLHLENAEVFAIYLQ